MINDGFRKHKEKDTELQGWDKCGIDATFPEKTDKMSQPRNSPKPQRKIKAYQSVLRVLSVLSVVSVLSVLSVYSVSTVYTTLANLSAYTADESNDPNAPLAANGPERSVPRIGKPPNVNFPANPLTYLVSPSAGILKSQDSSMDTPSSFMKLPKRESGCLTLHRLTWVLRPD